MFGVSLVEEIAKQQEFINIVQNHAINMAKKHSQTIDDWMRDLGYSQKNIDKIRVFIENRLHNKFVYRIYPKRGRNAKKLIAQLEINYTH